MKRIFLCYFIFLSTLFASEFNLSSKDGAVKNLTPLKNIELIDLKLKNNIPVTGLDFDEESGLFLIGTLGLELYTMDENFQDIKSYLKSTKDWIIQMEDGVSASFFHGLYGIMSYNKTYEFFKHVPNQPDKNANEAWRYLTDGYKDFVLDFKDRYYTIRAKQQYILSWNHSKFYKEFFIASVPDDIKKSWSVASFSDGDGLISTEFVPVFDESLDIKNARCVEDYYITGMDAQEEFVYLLSKQYSSILKLDPRSRKIVEVFSFDGLSDPRAIAIKDGKFYIASRENGVNKIGVFEKQ